MKQAFLTVEKVSMDPVHNPPSFRVKGLVPICSRNSIILCTFKGALYH